METKLKISVSSSLECFNAGCIDVDATISDHKATFVDIKFEFIKHTTMTKKVWFYYKAD